MVRYLPSQQYRPHFDWFDPTAGKSYRRKTAAGGQRAVTCLVYLAAPERGGRTSFPTLGLVRAGRGPAGDGLKADLRGCRRPSTTPAPLVIIPSFKPPPTK